jgi:hypothetical protein
MRSNERIATLAQTSLRMGVLAAGMMRGARHSHRVRGLTTPIGPFFLLKSVGRLDKAHLPL